LSFRKGLKDKREQKEKVLVFKKDSKGQKGAKREGTFFLEGF